MSPHAVISGASIAGLSAAFWLRRAGWDVTVLERSETFRVGGQNVDIRGVGREVLDRMGLFGAVRAQNTTETGTVLVNASGEVTAELPGGGGEGATAELEVLRGDLARVILDALPAGVELSYGDPIADVENLVPGVRVRTGSGREIRADLLVIAEGVRSRTREMIFADLIDRRELGITMVFGTIPRMPSDDSRWRWYNAVGGRQVHLRPDNHGTTRAILSFSGAQDLSGLEPSAMMARLRDRYAGAGWQAPRVLNALQSSQDVYVDNLTQIRMSSWHRGPVCVLGDAAWCVTPIGGGGASLALISGYVLSAYLSHCESMDVEPALNSFERWMRPLVDQTQNLPRGLKYFAYPQTRVGLKLRKLADRALTSRPLAGVAAKLTQVADTAQPLPEFAAPTP